MNAVMSSRDVPYTSRDLSLRELQKQDVWRYCSPKQGQLTTVVGFTRAMQGLELEFNPGVVAYVPRPRTLLVGEVRYEFSYWHREAGGREVLSLHVRPGETVPGAGGRQRHRQADALLAAAEAAQLPLHFVFESELPRRSVRHANYYRLLPSVQAARSLPNRLALRSQVLEIVGSRDRMRLDQLEQQLGNFVPADVRCVVADLLHGGELVCDWDRPLDAAALLGRAAP